MARRGNEGLADALVTLPWWVSFLATPVVFAFCKFAPVILYTEHPLAVSVNVFAAILSAYAYFFAGIVLLASAASAALAYRKRRLLDRQTGIDSIRNLSWREFELLVGEAFRRQGYVVEETGGGGADGGVDLRLRRDGRTYVVQCKRWKTWQVGVSPVRELFGVMAAEKADGAIFVSSGSYTPDALRFGEENSLTLIDGAALHDMIQGVQKSPQPTSVPDTSSAPGKPACPSCGGEMVLRQAKRGANVGKEFWGCVGFPKCKGTRSGIANEELANSMVKKLSATTATQDG